MRFPIINWYFIHCLPLPIPLPKWVCDELTSKNENWLRHSLYLDAYKYLTFIGSVGVPKDKKAWKWFLLVFIYHFNIRPWGLALGFDMPTLVTVSFERSK